MDNLNNIELNNKQLIPLDNNFEITKKQNTFLQSTFGIAINEALNYGIKKILPDFLEKQVIEVKDALFNNGLTDGIKTAIDKALDLGKSAIGIVTGNFKKISQIETAVQKGGLIDSASKLIDKSLNNANKENYINNDITQILKEGKNIIKNSLNKSITSTLNEQKQILKSVEEYCKNWEKSYGQQDFNAMEKEYQRIKEEIVKIVPLEETLQKINEIENIHNLIKNNGQDFNISENAKELARRLT